MKDGEFKMKKHMRLLLFLISVGINVLFFCLCDYWVQSEGSYTPKLDLICGIVAVIALGLMESRFLVQLLLRIRFSSAKKRIFDIRIWVQGVLLATYYIGCISLKYSVEFDYGVTYIALFAGVLAVVWLGFIKGGRVLWTAEDGSYFLDENGKFYSVIHVNESETQMFIECKVNERRSKPVIFKKKF